MLRAASFCPRAQASAHAGRRREDWRCPRPGLAEALPAGRGAFGSRDGTMAGGGGVRLGLFFSATRSRISSDCRRPAVPKSSSGARDESSLPEGDPQSNKGEHFPPQDRLASSSHIFTSAFFPRQSSFPEEDALGNVQSQNTRTKVRERSILLHSCLSSSAWLLAGPLRETCRFVC